MSSILVDSDILIEVLRAQARGCSIVGGYCSRERAALLFPRYIGRDSAWHAGTGAGTHRANIFLDAQHPNRDRDWRARRRLPSRLSCQSRLGIGDALIAATASVHHLDLWTRNRKHFPMKDVQFFA